MLGLFIGGEFEAVFVHGVNIGVRQRHQQRRVGSNQKLAAHLGQAMDAAEQRQLVLRRKGGFRFVEDIKPASRKTVEAQRHEAFINIGSDVIKAFGAQEKACAGAADAAHQLDCLPERGVGVSG